MSEEEKSILNIDEVNIAVNIRDSSYGGFEGISDTCQKFKDIARDCPSWKNLEASEREGLDMIFHKITRILYSPGKIRDSWVDIGGYAKATLKALDREGVKMS